MNTKTLFSASFSEGGILKNLIEYLKITNHSGTFFFSKDKITFRQSEVNTKIINKIEIRCKDLSSYEFNNDSEISIGVNLHDVSMIVKYLGKKDSWTMFQNSDEKTILYFLNMNLNSLSGQQQMNTSLVRLQCIDIMAFEEPIYSQPETNPNITMNSQEFVRIWKTFCSMKCDNINIIGRGNGLVIVSISKGQIYGRVQKIGNTEEINLGNDIENHPDLIVTIDSSTMKSLCKIGSLSSAQSVIKIFMEKGKPLKIIANIGTFGKLEVFVFSNS